MIANILNRALMTIRQYPVVFLFAVLAEVLLTYIMRGNKRMDFEQFKMAMVLVMGIPTFFSVRMLEERFKGNQNLSKLRVLFYALGVLFLLSFHLYAQSVNKSIFGFLFFQFNLGIHFIASYCLFSKDARVESFWEFNKRLFNQTFFSTIYTGFLYIGGLLILLSLQYLFDFKFDKIIFWSYFFFCGLIFHPLHFLSHFPPSKDNFKEIVYPKGLEVLVQNLLIPLLCVYLLILYIYLGKIIFEFNLPKGMVSWMISIMSVLGILNLLLIFPSNAEKRKVTLIFKKYFSVALLPLIVLLFIAVIKRISDYGITESRYFLFAIACWLTGICLYNIFSKKKDIRLVPISLSVMILLSSFGPWGAYSVSLKSQLAQFDSILLKHGLLVEGKAKSTKGKASKYEQKRLSSIITYINEYHGPEVLWPYLTLEQRTRVRKSHFKLDFADALGFDYYNRYHAVKDSEPFHYNTDPFRESLSIKGYESVMRFSGNRTVRMEFGDDEYKFDFNNKKLTYEVRKDSDLVMELNLMEVFKKVSNSEKENGSFYPRKTMEIKGQNSEIEVMLHINYMTGDVSAKDVNIKTVTGYIFLKSR